MPPVTTATASGVTAHVTRRWQAADPLLPPAALVPGCGTELVVAGPDGRPVAAGTCEHWAAEPGSLDLSWSAARRFDLTAHVAGPDIAGPLDQLLTRWREHLADEPGADDEDTAATVTWPSRDIGAVATLVRHGLAPLEVIAARTPGRGPATPATAPGVRVRRADPADVDDFVRLGLEVVRFDAHFSSVIERPNTADALRREATEILAAPEPWTWLAERDGEAVGMISAQRPDAAAWIAPMAGAAPVAYVLLLGVQPGQRGGGIGAALAARLHRELDAGGAAISLLHYAQLNPLSAPFWSQQGYRPLWSTWEARPARAIR